MMDIVAAKEKYIDEVEVMYDELNDYLEMHTNYPGWLKGVYPVRETAEEALRRNELFVLKIDDQIAGSIILNHKQEEAYIKGEWRTAAADDEVMVVHTVVVHPHFQRRGVAESLLRFAIEHAKNNGIKSLRLDVSVKNAPAITLYEKCGFSYSGKVDLGLPYDHLKWFYLYEYSL